MTLLPLFVPAGCSDSVVPLLFPNLIGSNPRTTKCSQDPSHQSDTACATGAGSGSDHQESTEAIVEVTSTGHRGSNIPVEILAPFMTPGDVLDHQPMGCVRAVGSESSTSMSVIGSSCRSTSRAVHVSCAGTERSPESQRRTLRPDRRSLFGYTKLYGQVPCGRAEFPRVPHADDGPIKVPEARPTIVSSVSDVLLTGWQAVECAGSRPGVSRATLGRKRYAEAAEQLLGRPLRQRRSEHAAPTWRARRPLLGGQAASGLETSATSTRISSLSSGW
jgi:hypothetical protein